jgi:hypothetical protein
MAVKKSNLVALLVYLYVVFEQYGPPPVLLFQKNKVNFDFVTQTLANL